MEKYPKCKELIFSCISGNICRSPIAEAVFKELLAEQSKTDEVSQSFNIVTDKQTFGV